MPTPQPPSHPAAAENPTPPPLQVALVGHCGPDAWMLKGVVSRALPGARVVMVSDAAAAAQQLEQSNLLLINRALDGDFASDSGLDLIRTLMASPQPRAALMLVSNFADAQAQAQALGAAPGFGKTKAASPETAQRLRDAVAPGRQT